ncbi:MAG: GNAT family N-acetyltransferase [Elusimicrobia bacterium]|nr:GNAT family N-acetyltransferase [Elusimicrobiota bacterium]
MIRALAPDELSAAAHLAAAAFREDPGFSHILPDDAQRRFRLPSLIEAILRVDVRLGGRALGAFDEGALVGMSAILPAGTPNPGMTDWLKRAPGLSWLLGEPAALLRALALSAAVERLRPAGDDYLHLLAVHPATQGRGIGAALLRDALKSEKPLYLETFTAQNAAWYEARGFTRRLEVASPVRPTFWTLRRSK